MNLRTTQGTVDVMAVGLVQVLDNTLAGSSAMPTTCRPLRSRPSTDMISCAVRTCTAPYGTQDALH